MHRIRAARRGYAQRHPTQARSAAAAPTSARYAGGLAAQPHPAQPLAPCAARRHQSATDSVRPAGGASCRRQAAARSAAPAEATTSSSSPFSSSSSREDATTSSSTSPADREELRPAAVSDTVLRVRISLAASSGKLDLTDCGLTEVPPDVWDLGPDLEELSLAGNRLTQLPDEGVARLSGLKRLGLAGNSLTSLPSSLGHLTALEGLWAHGNLLTSLPDSIGSLANLSQLSLAGNRLRSLPESVGGLASLTDLSVAGNRLAALPDAVVRLAKLKRLAANGNRLTCLPPVDWSGLASLEELLLMGNQLTRLPDALLAAHLPRLAELNLADNRLTSLASAADPASSLPLSGLSGLRKLWLYGNCLTDLPPGGLLPSLPRMQSAWLEGNPFSGPAVRALLAAADAAPELKALGLDEEQLAAAGGRQVALSAAPGVASKLRVGKLFGSSPGYFKLQRSAAAAAAAAATAAAAADGADAAAASTSHGADTAGSSSSSSSSNRVLVVAFGSAPGEPNWGGLLSQVSKAMDEEKLVVAFDVLFVVDPHRSWYGAADLPHEDGDDSSEDNDSRDGPSVGGGGGGYEHYYAGIEAATAGYQHVVMIGDSMGATAALLFAPLATAVLAFCPQVDLTTSAIRPGRSRAGLQQLRARVLSAASAAPPGTSITALVGTWQHDLDQANLLPPGRVDVKVFSVDSHRLALALNSRGKLAPLVQDAVLRQLGLRSAANIRLQNFV